jgi:hypothetical protein
MMYVTLQEKEEAVACNHHRLTLKCYECESLEYFDPIKEGPVRSPLIRLKDTHMWLCKELQKTEVALEKAEGWYVTAKPRYEKNRETLMQLIKQYREAIEQLSSN